MYVLLRMPMYKFIILFFFSLQFAQAQLSKTDIFNPKLDSLLFEEDYWETELTDMTDLNSVVQYIHSDPFRAYFIANIPAGNPLMRDISVNSFYGARNHPIHNVVKFHRGIDLAGKLGEKVVSSGNGYVLETGFKADLGNYIKIRHKYGFEAIYGHLSKVNVKKGQLVTKNQVIGKVGATGKVTGPHLHYTLKKNEGYLDPFDFLFMSF